MTVKLDTRKLDRLIKENRPGVARTVEKYGWAIAGEAATNAPIDTGALRNSITSESNMDADALTFTVQDGVTYGIFQELGTSRMAAQPFLVPAVLHWEQRFLAAFKTLYEELTR
jgi:HK97 gp10 family phage protein